MTTPSDIDHKFVPNNDIGCGKVVLPTITHKHCFDFVQKINSPYIKIDIINDYADQLYNDIRDSDCEWEFKIENYLSLPECMIENTDEKYFEKLSEKYKKEAIIAYEEDCVIETDEIVCKTCKGSTKVKTDDGYERCEDCC